MRVRRYCPLLWALLVILPLTGCLFRSHKVTPQVSSANLQTATQAELIQRINSSAEKIRTLNATVDIATSVGGVKKGKVTEYQEIRGYILVRQPGMLRMIGLMPVIRNRAFDMVSDGADFKLWVPPSNKFYVGRNDTVSAGATGLTSLRPQIVYDSLLLNDIDLRDEIAVMESGVQTVVDPKTHKETEQPDYRVDVINRGRNGWYLARKIYVNRVDLQPDRQTVYDANGNVTTENRYGGWKQYGDIWFPSVIQIWRPAEEYEITIGVVKAALNEPLTDQQFALSEPPGVQVIHLNGAPVTASDAAPR
jgi:outer membrane lipoprotein-sorting protein